MLCACGPCSGLMRMYRLEHRPVRVGFVADTIGVTGFSPRTALFLCHNHSISAPYSFNYLSLTSYRVNETCTVKHPEGNLHHSTSKNCTWKSAFCSNFSDLPPPEN